MQKPTILVTGGAGYIGSHAVLALLAAGYGVVILDDLSTGHPALLAPEAKFYQGDIADRALLDRIFTEQKISAVMHFAAKLIVPESVVNPELYHHNNVEKFSVLMDAIGTAKIPHVIFSSTAAVYGDLEISPITETAPVAPTNPYGATKLAAEKILQKQNAKHVILRYFNVAGADPAGRAGQMRPMATHLINVAAEVAVGKRPLLEIMGTDYPTPDGTCVRDYIHVSDLADAHVKALQYLENGGDSVTLNCGYGRGYSVAEVVDMVSAAVRRPLPVTLTGRRAGDPAILVADSEKLRTLLQWTPIYDNLRDIVKSAVAWEQKTDALRAAQKAQAA